MLWVYAANDLFFGPPLARRLHDAFGGGNAKFIDAPAYGEDGHYLYSVAGRAQWTPLLDAFLRERGLGGRDVMSLPDPLPVPGQLSSSGRDEFARYLASASPHRAFAVSAKGGFGWRAGRASAADAQADALAAGGKWASDCRLYAIDDHLVGGLDASAASDRSTRSR